MPVVKNIMVRAGADFSAITRQSKKASAAMKNMHSSVSASCSGMNKAVAGLKKAFSAIGIGLSAAAVVSFAKDAAEAFDAQAESEVRLARVMKNTMGATNDQIQSILDLTSAQQGLGIVGDEVQLAGAQELATYLSLTSSLQALIPVMNNMAAQQYGYNVTAAETTSIATMLGKVMQGQVGGLSRLGYYFDETQEKVLKYGTESQRAAMLAEVVEQSVGGMNAALAATPTGRMKQLSNTLGDIKEQFGRAVRTIGTAFLPVLNAVAKVLAAIATLANRVAQSIANLFGGSAAGNEWQFVPAGAAAPIEETSEAVDDLTTAEKKNTKSAKETKKAREQLQQASFDTLEILSDRSSDSTGEEAADADDTAVPTVDTAGGPLIQSTAMAETASEGLSGFQKVLEKLRDIWESFRAKLDLEKVGAAVGRLKEALVGFGGEVLKVLGSLFERVLEPLAVWTFSEALPAFLDVAAAAVDVLSAAIEKLRPAGEWLWDHFLQPIAAWVGDKFIEGLTEIARQLENIAGVIRGGMSLGEFLGQLSPLETALLGVAAALAAIHLVTAGIAAFGLITKIGGLVAGIKLLLTPLTSVGIVIGGLVTAVVNFVQQWQSGWNVIKSILEALGLAVAAVGAVILGAPALVAGVVAGIVFAVSQLAIVIHDHWEEIKAWLAGIPDWFHQHVAEPVRSFSEKLWNVVSVTARVAWEGLVSKAQSAKEKALGIFRSLRDGFQQIVEKIKGLLKFDWSFPKPKMPHISWTWQQVGKFVSVPKFHIDWYAKGGIVDAATLLGAGLNRIGVGEAGKEAIVPLERNMGWVTRVADQIRADFTAGAEALPTVLAGVDDGIIDAFADVLFDAVSEAGGGRRGGTRVAQLIVNGREFARAIFEDEQAVARERGISLINT